MFRFEETFVFFNVQQGEIPAHKIESHAVAEERGHCCSRKLIRPVCSIITARHFS